MQAKAEVEAEAKRLQQQEQEQASAPALQHCSTAAEPARGQQPQEPAADAEPADVVTDDEVAGIVADADHFNASEAAALHGLAAEAEGLLGDAQAARQVLEAGESSSAQRLDSSPGSALQEISELAREAERRPVARNRSSSC